MIVSFTIDDSLKAKGVGIMLLIFHHLFFTKARFEPYGIQMSFSENTLITVANACRICVWIFVFISAYGLTIQFEKTAGKESAGKFVFRRWYSLMKPFWFIYVLVVCVLCICGISLARYEGAVSNVILDFFGVADLVGSPTLSGTWWYMAYAQIMLILMPLLISAGRKYGGCQRIS